MISEVLSNSDDPCFDVYSVPLIKGEKEAQVGMCRGWWGAGPAG